MQNSKAILIIMDGLGESQNQVGNAVLQAKTPNLDSYKKKYSNVLLNASGNAVGLPEGVMGASEPGHLTMGAGRIVWQPLEEINQAIKSCHFFENKIILKLLVRLREKRKPLHLIGMISDAGVHSHTEHLFSLLQMAKHEGIQDVYIHAIADGRDVPERSVEEYLEKVENYTKFIGVGNVVSLIGRFYAMDRDQNYDRTQVAYDLYINAKGKKIENFAEALHDAYQAIDTDYYLTPYVFEKFKNIEENDGVIFVNFRSDRARQLTNAFLNQEFTSFKRPFVLKNFVAMGPYAENAPVAFPPQKVVNNCGSWLAQKKIPQLRIAETEKYAHVTFFFNSQEKEPYAGEDRILVNSPKCRSYAEKPEMSAIEVKEKVIQQIKKQHYGAIILNFANPDLVGHSGDLQATIRAVETVDKCVGEVVENALENDYKIILTADHGNAEQMLYPDSQEVCPSHTTNPVRCYLLGMEKIALQENLGLSSIMPTMFKMMEIEIPSEMKGKTLF